MPGRVESLILIEPCDDGRRGYRRGCGADLTADLRALAAAAPNLVVAISAAPDRRGTTFSWRCRDAEMFIGAATSAGLEVRQFEVSDPNVVAEGEAIPAGIAAAIGR